MATASHVVPAPPAFGLNPEQEATLELADKFGSKELAPLAGKMDDE